MNEKDNWTGVSEVLSIFPTCVWKNQLKPEFSHSVNSNILQLINQINPDLAKIPPGGSWQLGQDLHNREQLVDIVSCIHRTAQTILRFLKVGYNAIEITACWANFNAVRRQSTWHRLSNS